MDIKIVVIASLVLLAVGLKVKSVSGLALLEGRRAQSRGDIAGAVDQYGRAALWTLPFAGDQDLARERLVAIAAQAEHDDRMGSAARAYRALRASLLGSRSGLQSERDLLLFANSRLVDLADLANGVGDPKTAHSASSPGAHVSRSPVPTLSAAYARTPGADGAWALCAGLGMLLFVAGGWWLPAVALRPGHRQGMAAALSLLVIGATAFFVGLAGA